jgi:hypothetical protein
MFTISLNAFWGTFEYPVAIYITEASKAPQNAPIEII